MKEMTRAEEQIMQYLWKIKKGYMKDIVDEFPEPKPAYTTVATVLTTMVKKGFVDFKQFGNVREYYPKIKKNEYFGNHIKDIIKKYYNNSVSQFASFFTAETKLSIQELEELKKFVDDQIAEQKK